VPYRHLRHVPPDSIATVVNSPSVHGGLLCPGDRFSARSQQGQRNESGVKIDCKNLGNFSNNVAAMGSGIGDVIAKRRSSKTDNPDNFLPCEYCYGFVQTEL